jgi:prevent-host-death family protein
MTTVVPSRELRNDTRGLLRRVEAGEELIITVDGRAVARLAGISQRPRFISREEFARRFLGRQADPGLRADLDELAGGTTDELPPL